AEAEGELLTDPVRTASIGMNSSDPTSDITQPHFKEVVSKHKLFRERELAGRIFLCGRRRCGCCDPDESAWRKIHKNADLIAVGLDSEHVRVLCRNHSCRPVDDS